MPRPGTAHQTWAMITRRDLALKLAPLLMAGVVTASGCTLIGSYTDAPGPTGAGEDPATATSMAIDAQALFKARTPHLGDNSAVIRVVDATRVSLLGQRTLALITDRQPLTLVISLTDIQLDEPRRVKELVTERAVLMLACISNADLVRWTVEGLDGASGELSRADADTLAGAPVAGLATSAPHLTALAEKVQA